MPRFKEMPLHPDQALLFPQTVDEALPTDSDVRAFNDVMECMDYSGIESKCFERGCPPYPPKVMVKILGYAYSKGIRSSRRIEDHLKIDIRFIWLAGGLKPDHNTLARFRKQNWEELIGLFGDSVRVCCAAGLVFLNAVSTDGSKIAALASRKRVYGEGRLEREIAAVENILQEAEEVDRVEDEQCGSGAGDELPERLRDAKERKARLESIAKRLKESSSNTVVESDPESRVMMTGEGKRPGYNLQASVDAENQIIVAMKLTHSENDHGLLPEMVAETEANTGLSPDVSLADSGYGDEGTLKWLDKSKHNALIPLQKQPQESKRNDLFASKCFLPAEGADALVCPAGRKLVFKGEYRMGSGVYKQYVATGCQTCSFREECVGHRRGSRRINISVVADQRKQMLEKLDSPEGRELYSLRQETAEPVFGRIKENMGFRRFLLPGLKGATAEAALVCMAHNVSKCAASIAAMSYLAVARVSRPLPDRVLALLGDFMRWLGESLARPYRANWTPVTFWDSLHAPETGPPLVRKPVPGCPRRYREMEEHPPGIKKECQPLP